MSRFARPSSVFILPAVPLGVRLQVSRAKAEGRRLVAAASPVALLGLLNMALGLTDMVMVGRFDPQGFAAIVVMGDLQSIVFNFTAGLAGLVAPYVSAAIGARVAWQVCTIVQRVAVLVATVAMLGIFLIWNAAAILEAAGVRLDQPEITRDYARYMAWAYGFMVLFAFGRYALGAVGRSGFAIGVIALALPLNALANHVFMAGAFGRPGLGAAGAGLASLVVAIGMGGSVMAYLFLSPSFGRYRAPVMPPVFVLPELLTLVRPAVLMGLAAVAETGPFLVATLLVGAAASDELMAHGLAFRAMAVCYLLLVGLGQAVTLRVAYLRGRSAYRREAHTLAIAGVFGAALVASILALFGLNPALVAFAAARGVGIDDPGLIADTAALLPLTGLALAAAVPAHLVCAMLRARGQPLAALAVFATGHSCAGMTAMAVFGAAGLGAAGVWSGLVLGALIGSACALWRLRSGGISEARPAAAGGVKFEGRGGLRHDCQRNRQLRPVLPDRHGVRVAVPPLDDVDPSRDALRQHPFQ
jgi:multidrug resistance protein, MATE family